MAHYIDGYIIPIKKKNLKAYKKMAVLGCKLWTEHGALDYYECVGDELNLKWGIPFAKLCGLKSDETVIFAFIKYKSKAHRNKVNKLVHSDPRMNMQDMKMPFDMKRFSSAGFKSIVNM
ncbi:MAG: DUF1428 domain-containing protein [Proteobacteria bacterium]|nr:DUF1428 domain-containing protein [Pseudomonadota bacterium]